MISSYSWRLIHRICLKENVLVPQRTFPHHRSENMPYGYEYPNIGYPVAHSMDHSISMIPSSKQLIVVSFIGLLLLLAIIQNTLSSVKRKDAIMDLLSSRQKRDVYATRDFRSVVYVIFDVINLQIIFIIKNFNKALLINIVNF